jgi:NAD(P)-dependent dehydrogenase (short-subunit alcohol dehydrogenase family)
MPSKRVLLTGATGGLGQAVAWLLDQLGHRTLLSGRDPNALSALADRLSQAEVLCTDLAESQAPDRLVQVALERLGGLDGVINNAGTIAPIAPLSEASLADWTKAMQVNLTAPAMIMRAALPALRQSGGRIVNISTGAALKPMPGWSAYCASKAGLLQLSRVVAVENPEVGCFSLRPGVIDTGMQAAIRDSSGMRTSDQQRFFDLHQQGALEPPQVPARAAVWLVLQGPLERSGQLIEYTDAEVVSGVEALAKLIPNPGL